MLYRLINQCTRISPYKINHFTRLLYQIPPIKENQTPKLNSTIKDKKLTEERYPGYEIIYKYPYMKYISLYHIFKRNMLICNVGSMLVLIPLCYGNVISGPLVIFIPLIVSSFTIAVFIVGALFTNQIGIIYYKDKDFIKIAYVNRWGKRIDIDTKISDIKPLNSTAYSITTKSFKNIHIASLKFPLKLYVNHSIIKNKEQLISILGDYE